MPMGWKYFHAEDQSHVMAFSCSYRLSQLSTVWARGILGQGLERSATR